jgi:hypothetical protein
LFNEVYDTVLRQECEVCHGLAPVPLVLDFFVTGDYSRDLASFYNVSIQIDVQSGLPLILAKPTRQIPHLGGQQFQVNSPEYQAIRAVTDRIADPFCTVTP